MSVAPKNMQGYIFLLLISYVLWNKRNSHVPSSPGLTLHTRVTRMVDFRSVLAIALSPLSQLKQSRKPKSNFVLSKNRTILQ